VESSAVDEGTKPDSSVSGSTQKRTTRVSPTNTMPEPAPIGDASTPTPPAAPTVPKDKDILDFPAPTSGAGTGGDTTKGSGSGSPPPPVAPAGTEGDATTPTRITPKDKDGLVQRSAGRPVLPRAFVRTTAKGDLNLLEGLVKSAATGQPEQGVELTVSSRTRAFADRRVRSDASGRYAVRLPDGDWTVMVTLASGERYPVRGLTVSNGQIVDDLGRDIPTLTITR
jgi:hypothetical protein